MTIQYIMLVSLGFLIASLITLLLAPIFWQRAVRLTASRLRQSLPLTEQEILADKDQLRAKYAIRVHQLEKQVEHATLGGARQKIDLNRRDADITRLETEIERLNAVLEENQNARLVLEQTIGDRIPKIETKLNEARKILLVRDREVAELSQTSRRQQDALAEAQGIAQKQKGDIDRLRAQLKAYEMQARQGKPDPDADAALALQTELELLRARTQEQTALIDKLTTEMIEARATLTDGMKPAINASTGDDATVVALRREIATLQERLARSGGSGSSIDESVGRQADGEWRAAKAKIEDQAAEISRLRAELEAALSDHKTGDGGQHSLRDNRIALKARVSGLEAHVTQQAETIDRLRADLAQASDRATRQAESFSDEIRKLGVAAHVTQPRADQARSDTRRNVLQRTRKALEDARPPGDRVAGVEFSDINPGDLAPTGNITPLARRLVNGGRSEPDGESPPGRVSTLVAAVRSSGDERNDEKSSTASKANVDHETGASPATPARQSRLLDRITAADGKGS